MCIRDRIYTALISFIIIIACLVIFKNNTGFALTNKVKSFCSDTLELFKNNFAVLLLNFVLSTVKMSLIGLAYYLVFTALSVDRLEMIPTMLLCLSSGLIAYLPISLNGIGTVEATAFSLFALFDYSQGEILSLIHI